MNKRREKNAPSRAARQLGIVLALTLSTILTACGDDGALEGLATGRQARVDTSVSGDELKLDDGQVVRLAGVEAPKAGAPYADAARDTLARLAGGRRVNLLYGGARTDPFGRPVAQVRTVDGHVWLEGALLDQGAVRVRTFADNRALARAMLQREARARAAHRGLWALDAYKVRLPEEVTPDDHGLTVVEGRVAGVGRDRAGDVYLDFTPDWHSGVSAEIPRAALRDFRAAGLDPADLQGRLVRVRGAIHGLRLALDHPEQIERLKG